MGDFEFDLKEFRETKLKCTQVQLADRMGLTQDQISRLENNPKSISLEFILKLCEVAGMGPTEVVNFKISQPKPFEVKAVYNELSIRRNTLDLYVKPRRAQFESEEFNEDDINKINEVFNVIDTYGSKPLVALMGPSDAGKSRMINALIGGQLLKSQRTPTTAVTVYVKHIDDKPEWMDSSVMVFRAESKNSGWNFHKWNDKHYCKSLKVASGSIEVLEEYCNRDSKRYVELVDSAVVYVDSPVLKACDIVDLPGFGTESLSETVHSQRAREQADIIIFLCQSTGFFNKHDDILFLKEVIHRLPTSSKIPVLSNLFVVASQAAFIEKESPSAVEDVLQRGYEVIKEQISRDLIKQHFNVDENVFFSALKSRFFTYATENSTLRRKFENELRHTLQDVLPPMRISLLDETIKSLKTESKGYFEQQIEYFESVLDNIEAAKLEADDLERNKYDVFNRLRTAKTQVIEEIESLRKDNREKFREWEKHKINVDKIKSIIKEKAYDKKKAQQFLGGNVSDLYYAKLQDLLQNSTVEFNEVLSKFFSEAEKLLVNPARQNTGPVRAPFDFKGAIAGALAGITVFGGLSLWASTLGNLGAYILVTQGVGVLSALGISVGGGAAAVSAVAAIGGPITIGIGIALGAFLVIKGIVGDGWKERLAKKLLDAIKDDGLLDKYIDSIDQYWSDTRNNVDLLVDELIMKYEEYIENRRAVVSSSDPKMVLKFSNHAERMRDFFDFLPW